MSIFDGMADMMSGSISGLIGGNQTYSIVTRDHGTISADGVFTASALAATVSPQGARQHVRRSQIDLRRSQLARAGLADMSKDLHGARVMIGGKIYTLTEIEDDGRAFVTCALRISSQ